MRDHRIVLVATEFSTGGLGSYLVTMANGLTARGWEVHLLATDSPGNLYSEIGEPCVHHDLSGIPLSVRKVRRTAELLDRIAPAVVLLNHAALAHYALPMIEAGVRPVAVIHSDDRRYYRTAAFFQHRVFGWVTPSRGLAEHFSRSLPEGRRSRVRVIPHGVEARLRLPPGQCIRPREAGGGAREEVNIIFVGFLGRTKGADLIPAIMRRVWLASPSARLTVVGEGPLREEVEAALTAGGIIGQWRFAGAVARDEVFRLLRDADMLILPTQLEGFGLTIPEAMLSGCVPVVSRLAGITDQIVDSGRTGFLVEQTDVAGFADALIRLAKDPVLRGACAAAGRADAELRFSTDRMLDGYEAFFEADDDRGPLRVRSLAGWAAETARELPRHRLDTRWFVRRVRECAGYRA